MALLDRLFPALRVSERAGSPFGAGLPLVSPLASSPSSQMSRLVWSEFYAGEIAEVTREGALMVPPLKRGRDLITATIAGMPLHEYRGEEDVTPRWLRNSSSGISPWHRMAATVDDLLFYDWSAWAVTRGADGAILDAIRIPYERWAVDDMSGVVTVDGQVVSAEEIVVFPGNGSGGVLAAGAQTIKGYRALERSWIGRAQNPIPLVELHQTTDDPLDGDEIETLATEWAAARLTPNGAVGYTPHNIELRVHGSVSADLFENGRNAAVLDVARLLNLPAALLDGAQAAASLTYVTTEGKRSEFAALSIPAWLAPIEARLSLDDVAPAGHVVRFDQSSLVDVIAEPVNTPRED